MHGEKFKLEFEGENMFETSEGAQSPVVEIHHGHGKVILVSHARPLRNAFIGRNDHAEFLRCMIENGTYYGKIGILHGQGLSFWRMVWRHGWRPLLVMLVILLMWLWMRLPRFGPRLRWVSSVGRDYGEQLRAGARFLWQRKSIGSMIRPLRKEIENRFQVKQGELDEATRASLFETASQRTGYTVEEVIEAMSRENFDDAASLTRVVRRLQKINHTL